MVPAVVPAIKQQQRRMPWSHGYSSGVGDQTAAVEDAMVGAVAPATKRHLRMATKRRTATTMARERRERFFLTKLDFIPPATLTDQCYIYTCKSFF
jgi:hypothetical protein